MYCTRCGAELLEGASFCTNCGAPVAPTAPAAGQEPVDAPAGDERGDAPMADAAPPAEPGADAAPSAEPRADARASAANPSTTTPAPRKGGKTALMAVAILVVVAVLGAGGYAVYRMLFAQDPSEAIAADLQAQLAAYADPASAQGIDLTSEADLVLSGLGAYPFPDQEAYDSWLSESSFEVGSVMIADDGNSATATATITHAPLIDYVEEYMGERDSVGDDQTAKIEVAYERKGSEWTASDDDLRAAVLAAYLPSDEELILSDVHWYFSDLDAADESFIAELESSAGGELDLMGITADEFADAYLDGFNYEVGAVAVDGDEATVELTISLKSLTDVMEEFETDFEAWAAGLSPSEVQGMTEADLYAKAGEMLLDLLREAEVQQHDVEIGFTQDSHGVWWMDDVSQDDLSDLAMMV